MPCNVEKRRLPSTSSFHALLKSLYPKKNLIQISNNFSSFPTSSFPHKHKHSLSLLLKSSMASKTNDNSTANTNLPPISNAEIISSSSVAALPKSEGASTESEPKVAAAASSEVVCVGRNNRAMTWGYSLNKGRRREMEDAITIVPSFMKLPCTAVGGCRAPDCKYAAEESSVHYFGLFDGHGGAQVTNCHHRFGNFLCDCYTIYVTYLPVDHIVYLLQKN